MTMSDFPESAALIVKGHCPLCEAVLKDAFCRACNVGWTLHGRGRSAAGDEVQIFGVVGVLIVPSRRLALDEIRRLYARSAQ